MAYISEMRREFYDAIDKSNTQKPKNRKVVREERKITPIEEQISRIIAESESAIVETVIVDNMPLVEWLYEKTKKSQEDIDIEKMVSEELEIINRLRDEARREYRQRNRMLEAISPSAAASASSAAAGAAGAGGASVVIRTTRNGYVVDDYVEDYLQ